MVSIGAIPAFRSIFIVYLRKPQLNTKKDAAAIGAKKNRNSKQLNCGFFI